MFCFVQFPVVPAACESHKKSTDTICSANTLNYTFVSLEHDTIYVVSVAAHNPGGASVAQNLSASTEAKG